MHRDRMTFTGHNLELLQQHLPPHRVIENRPLECKQNEFKKFANFSTMQRRHDIWHNNTQLNVAPMQWIKKNVHKIYQ
jgi:hypothetical protein